MKIETNVDLPDGRLIIVIIIVFGIAAIGLIAQGKKDDSPAPTPTVSVSAS